MKNVVIQRMLRAAIYNLPYYANSFPSRHSIVAITSSGSPRKPGPAYVPFRFQCSTSMSSNGSRTSNGRNIGNDSNIIHNETTELLSSLNPPTSTLPPPLDLPVRTPEIGLFKHLLATGKAYYTFYKAGLKAVIANYRIAKQLVEGQPPHFHRSLQKTPIPSLIFSRPIHPPPAHWNRADWVFFRRARHDILRLPLFGLLVLICDELTPFVVYMFAGIVPGTCRIPNQFADEQGKADGRRQGSFDWLATCQAQKMGLSGLDALALEQERQEKGSIVREKPNYLDLGIHKARLHATKSLSIIGGKWDVVLGDRALPGSWWLKGESRMAYLAGDDELLRRDGIPLGQPLPEGHPATSPDSVLQHCQDLIDKLSNIEVRLACKDRGIDTSDVKDDEVLRKRLSRWLFLTAGENWVERRKRITTLVMSRQSDWPTERNFKLPEWYL